MKRRSRNPQRDSPSRNGRALVRKPSSNAAAPQAEAEQSARDAGLRYVNDARPGIRRVRAGQAFRYLDENGKRIRNQETLRRIRALVIPPAWSDVWICPSANGHLQAAGRDARGRKQYRYHARWRQVRDESKYDRLLAFARALGPIRRHTERDLARAGLPCEKVLAAVVRLLETTLIRVGNDEYARTNNSFGLTTMRDRHAAVRGEHIRFHFPGKSGKVHEVDLDDRRLGRIVKQCRDLPGQELFQYLDEAGHVRDVGSQDVNDYLRTIAGQEFTAKDFRTWAGTVLAARALQEFASFDTKVQAKRNIVRTIEEVAKRLGNTTSVCRKCYVHPAVIEAYLDGTLLQTLSQKVEKELRQSLSRLSAEEAAVLAFLQARLKRDKEREKAMARGKVKKSDV
jgi:DNA topoisomerase-1